MLLHEIVFLAVLLDQNVDDSNTAAPNEEEVS